MRTSFGIDLMNVFKIALWCSALTICSTAYGGVPEAALKAMENRQVTLYLDDGKILVGELAGFSEAEVTIVESNGTIAVVDRSNIAEMKSGSPALKHADAPTGQKVVQDNEFVLRFFGTYDEAYQATEKAMLQLGGEIKVRTPETGKLEGKWKHGINMFGLRVTVSFTSLSDGSVQISFRGHFKDAFDTTGVAKQKARSVVSATLAELGG